MAEQSRIESFRTADVEHLDGHRSNGHGNGHQGGYDPHRASTGQLVSQAAGQISTLVRSELALGRAELVEKARKLGLGGGLLAGAAVLSPFAFGLLLALIVAVLDRDWPLWLATLVPLLALGALMLVLAGIGLRKLRSGAGAPTQAAHSVRDDIASVRQAFHDGRNSDGRNSDGRNSDGRNSDGRNSNGRNYR